MHRHYSEIAAQYNEIEIIIGASFPVNILMYHFYKQFNKVKTVTMYDTNKTVVFNTLPLIIRQNVRHYTEDPFQPWHIQIRNEKIADMVDTGLVITTKKSSDVFSLNTFRYLKIRHKTPVYVTV